MFLITIFKGFTIKNKVTTICVFHYHFIKTSLCIIHMPAHNYLWLRTGKGVFLQEGDLGGSTELGRRHMCTGNPSAPFEFCAVPVITSNK